MKTNKEIEKAIAIRLANLVNLKQPTKVNTFKK